MNWNNRVAVLSLVLLVPALVLATSGFLGLEPPAALVHPALVMGGLVLAFTLDALSVLRIRVGQDEGTVVATILVRMRGTRANLAALMLSCLLFATMTAYLFVENFQSR